jgi:hypothetical protein
MAREKCTITDLMFTGVSPPPLLLLPDAIAPGYYIIIAPGTGMVCVDRLRKLHHRPAVLDLISPGKEFSRLLKKDTSIPAVLPLVSGF